jgi:tetratricopeptide (TPR) repeat protein
MRDGANTSDGNGAAHQGKKGDATFSDQINDLFKREQWAQARKLLQKRLEKEPNSHWLLTRLGTTYYEERDYPKALDLSRRAIQLAPECPLVLWDLASTLEMLGDDRGALRAYRGLFARGPQRIADDECGEGMPWALSLLTDCLYSAAGCLHRIGDRDAAVSCLRQHLELRALGAKSIYTRRDVGKRFAEIAGSRLGLIEREIGDAERALHAV